MSEKRPYTKRDTAYWDHRAGRPQTPPVIVNTVAPSSQSQHDPVPMPDIGYGSTTVRETALAGAVPESSESARGRQLNNGGIDPGAFQNLRALPLPYAGWNGSREYVGMPNTIDLCAKAWAGVSVVRNAIEVAVEFSSQPLIIKTTNQTVKTFFNEWFNAVRMDSLKEQWFREYYRSGNVFEYAFEGKFGPAYFKGLQQSYGAKENRIPIRYELLNPTNVFVPTGLSAPYTYVRLLSTYEVERLRNPQTEQDKQVYNSLPPQVKAQIRNSASNPLGIYIPLEGKRLRFAFYKKQSYEPLAIPMVWPVLADVEWKLALKKMDMALARTIEHAILLVTTGETGNEWNKGNGINPNNIARLQSLFTNQSVGRVLVADWTTKAQWLIPDIKEILGPEKYAIVDADIREGLQSILTGNDKFANAQIKAKIFIQRLEEGQQVFLKDFLLPEVQTICERTGFRNVPTVQFKKIDLQDAAVMARVYTQMAQLGLLTADELNEALESGTLPDKDESLQNQKEYAKNRKDKLYTPLIGGAQDGAGQTGRPPGTSGIKQTTKKVAPIGTSKADDETASAPSVAFSIRAYADHLRYGQDLLAEVGSQLRTRFKVKRLNEAQSAVANTLARTIMATRAQPQWIESVAASIAKPPAIPSEVAAEIDSIRTDYSVDDWDATILRLCKTRAPSV